MPRPRTKPLKEFRPLSRNPNRHTPRGMEMLEDSLHRDGFVAPMTAVADGTVIDGNARLEKVATALPMDPIIIEHDGTRPIIAVRTDIPNERDPRARRIAVAANRVAEVNLDLDPEVMGELGKEIDLSAFFTSEELKYVLPTEDAAVEEPPWGSLPEDGRDEIHQLRDDPVFPSSNIWGIPDLRPDRLGTIVVTESFRPTLHGPDASGRAVVWGSNTPASWAGSLLVCYRHDVKLEPMWLNAPAIGKRLQSLGVSEFVGPDFSLYGDDPRAVHLWNIYRSRWIARYWQELGLLCVPNLQGYDIESLDYALLGLPKEIPVAMCQVRTVKDSEEPARYAVLHETLSRVKVETLMLYGEAGRVGRYADAVSALVGAVVRVVPYTEMARRRKES